MFLFIIVLSTIFLFACSNETASSLYKKGIKELKSNNFLSAKESFRLAIERKPDRADYIIYYANSLLLLNENEEAIRILDDIYMDKNLSIVISNNKKIHILKGDALLNMKKYEEALEEYNKALNILNQEELNYDVYKKLALIYQRQGLYDEAIKLLDVILEENKNDIDTISLIAKSYSGIKDFDNSIEYYQLAISLDELNSDHYINLYNVFLNNNDNQAAQEVFDSFVNLEGGDDFFFYLGKVYQSKKDSEKAILYYEKYIEQSEVPNPQALLELSSLYIKKGEYKIARSLCRDGIGLEDETYIKEFKRNEIISSEYMKDFNEAYEKIKEYLIDYHEEDAIKEKAFLEMILNK